MRIIKIYTVNYITDLKSRGWDGKVEEVIL